MPFVDDFFEGAGRFGRGFDPNRGQGTMNEAMQVAIDERDRDKEFQRNMMLRQMQLREQQAAQRMGLLQGGIRAFSQLFSNGGGGGSIAGGTGTPRVDPFRPVGSGPRPLGGGR